MDTSLRKIEGLWGIIIAVLLTTGCNATRHLEKDEYLLKHRVSIKRDGDINQNLLDRAIQLKPNRRLLIPKTYLHLYNFGRSLEKDSSFTKKMLLKSGNINRFYQKTVNWLTTQIGADPILVNLSDLRKDSLNLRNVCFSQGYFHPEITYEIDTINNWFEQQKANVSFKVREALPAVIFDVQYKLRDTVHQYSDSLWRSFVSACDTTASLLRQPGKTPFVYQHKLLEQERLRLTKALKNAGYFTFSQGMIQYLVDTTYSVPGPTIPRFQPILVTVEFLEMPPKFRIGEIKVNIRSAKDGTDMENIFTQTYRAENLSAAEREYYKLSQRKLADSVRMTFEATHTVARDINYNFIARRIYLKEGDLFNQDKARLTQQRLLELGMFQIASMNYDAHEKTGILNTTINLQTALRYQLKVGTETFTDFDFTTSSNLPVLGISLGISNKNAFKRSELLKFNFGGDLGLYASEENQSNFQSLFYELGSSIQLNIPQFLLPIGQKRNMELERLSPQTVFTGTINQERRREFNRLVTGLNLSYRWQHIRPNRNKVVSSILTPLAVDFIDISIRSRDFQQRIDTLPLAIQQDYQARFSSRTSYTFTYSTYGKSRLYATHYYQLNAEIGGNLPYLLDRFILIDSERGDNQINDNLFYGQYIKGSFEYKRFIPLSPKSELVLRGLIGAAKAYRRTGNDTTGNIYLHVPYEHRFFSGGANSMRGWRSNTLGPGTVRLPEFQNVFGIASASSLLAPGGELILEMNAEYRFDAISYLEMALFTDAGNVWFNQEISTNPESNGDEAKSQLSRDNLRLGWDAGIGFRFDFSFLVLRLDIAQQIYAPDKGWVVKRFPQNLGAGRTQYNLGVGYPF